MFHQLIQHKRDEWYASPECTVGELIAYIVRRGMMRDAQIEAIKTYLYLKIACGNKPLWQLYCEGTFNTLDPDRMPLTGMARDAVKSNPAAAALLEYALLKDRKDKPIAPNLAEHINNHVEELQFERIFRDIFYGVDYTDYLFSLPMGAGKTYLMAAFIYLDLYFARLEPDNAAFAHNFMIMVPSGLKTSILPSLKSIRNFDPGWILPEPVASELKRLIRFEVLDEENTAKKSNQIRNPNARKINLHLSDPDLIGLVAVTNAEKVILDRLDTMEEDDTILSEEMKKEMERVKVANELREIISRIPHLSIFIDEVHHAGGEQKLRKVVNGWSRKNTFCGMLGFSGTPYLETAKKVMLDGQYEIKNTEFSNIVYYYPLIDGIDNFLKHPDVYQTDKEAGFIVREGVGMFIDRYWNTTYSNGTKAKIAIYCGQVETLEEEIYPAVAQLVMERGFNPEEIILKYHKGSTSKKGSGKKYPEPEGAELEFASLDTPSSLKRIVLLVQIGKEGWDCKSLTGVILPHKNACPTNMVLQTSCRCLRQVERGAEEHAIIWLNRGNAETLNKQLVQQQDITLHEFANKAKSEPVMLKRYSRMEYLKLPPIDFYQLHVNYETRTTESEQDISALLQSDDILLKAKQAKVFRQDFSGNTLDVENLLAGSGEHACYNQWLHTISKESFSTLSTSELHRYDKQLKAIFAKITLTEDSSEVFDESYDQSGIRSRIRQCFMPLREWRQDESLAHEEFSLLKIGQPTSPHEVADPSRYFPEQAAVEEIINWDSHPNKGKALTPEVEAMLRQLEAQGLDTSSLREQPDPHPERKSTYHYLPYRFDSGLEYEMFQSALNLDYMKEKQLELYFNGDENLTDFHIECYHHDGSHWHRLGNYFPDFLLLQRRDGAIHKVMIIETKGTLYAGKFALRRKFMERTFVPQNKEHFGYQRFSFLYLEDSVPQQERKARLIEAIKTYFND